MARELPRRTVRPDIPLDYMYRTTDTQLRTILEKIQQRINDAVSEAPAGFVDIRRYGSIEGGSATQTFLDAAADKVERLYIPSGVYEVQLPNVSGTVNYLYPLYQNLHVCGGPGTVLKFRSYLSTDAKPKALAFFASDGYVSNLKFENIIFDFNGTRNPVDGETKPHAAIMMVGINGRADDVLFDGVVFRYSAGSNIIVPHSGTDSSSYVLGKNWRILNGLFLDNGLDTDDHSAIWGWVRQLLVQGNFFIQTAIPAASTVKCPCEIHGRDGRFVDNVVHRYTIGNWIGSNFTEAVEDSSIDNNVYTDMVTTGWRFWRENSTEKEIRRISITHNKLKFLNENPGSVIHYAGLAATTNYGIDDVFFHGNEVFRPSGETYGPLYGAVLECAGSGEAYKNWIIDDNTFKRMTHGIYAVIEASKGTIDSLRISLNRVYDFEPYSGGTPYGVYLTSPSSLPFKQVSIVANEFSDLEHPTNTVNVGIFPGGYYNYLQIAANTYRNMGSFEVNYWATSCIDRWGKGELRDLVVDSNMPVKGLFVVGDRLWRIDPVAASYPGWVCIARNDTTIRIQANGGDTTIEVGSTTGMTAWDRIGIVLDNNEIHWALISSITDGDTLVINIAIPTGRTAAVGKAVYTMHWHTMAVIA